MFLFYFILINLFFILIELKFFSKKERIGVE